MFSQACVILSGGYIHPAMQWAGVNMEGGEYGGEVNMGVGDEYGD